MKKPQGDDKDALHYIQQHKSYPQKKRKMRKKMRITDLQKIGTLNVRQTELQTSRRIKKYTNLGSQNGVIYP